MAGIERVTTREAEFKINTMGRRYDPLTGRFLRMPQTIAQITERIDEERRKWRGGVRTFYMGWKAQKALPVPESHWGQSLNQLEQQWNDSYANRRVSPETSQFLENFRQEQLAQQAIQEKGGNRWWGKVKEKVSSWRLPKIYTPSPTKLAWASVLALGVGVGEMFYNWGSHQEMSVGATGVSASELAGEGGFMAPRVDRNGNTFWTVPDQNQKIVFDIFHYRQAAAQRDLLVERNATIDDLANTYARINGRKATEFQPGQPISIDTVLNAEQRDWLTALRSIPLSNGDEFNRQLERARSYGF